MKRSVSRSAIVLVHLLGTGALGAACGDPLPEDVAGYESRCALLNGVPIPPYGGDPHRGMKNVFVCGVPLEAVRENVRPFPDGALVVKESTRAGESFPWLVATARKRDGRWRWDEYTRNFSDEEPRRILAPQSVCTGCHRRAQGADWIFTSFTGP